MDSAIDLTFKRLGSDIKTVTLVASEQHPGVEDISWSRLLGWLTDVGKGIADGLGGKWGDLVGDVRKFFDDVTAEENVSKAINGTVLVWQGGLVNPPGDWADEVWITYRAWSDDDLTDKSAMQVSSVGLAAPPAVDKGGVKVDAQHYNHTWAARLDNRGPSALVVAAGAGDKGWHFDVSIATVLVIILTPAVKQFRHSGALLQSNFGVVGNFELAAPGSRAGLALYWRNNDAETHPWGGPLTVAPELGAVDGVSMIQTSFGTPGLGSLLASVTAADTLWTVSRQDTPVPLQNSSHAPDQRVRGVAHAAL